MFSADLVYIAPYLMSAQKRREVSAANSAANSRKNSVAEAATADSSAAPSRSASPAPKKAKKQFDPLSTAVKMNMNARLL